MGDEGIIDGVAREIFLAEGDVESADAEIDPAVAIEPAAEVFEVEVEFAHAKILIGVLARGDVHLGEEVDVGPDRRLDEELRFVHAKLLVWERTFVAGVEEADATFAAEVDFSEIVGKP